MMTSVRIGNAEVSPTSVGYLESGGYLQVPKGEGYIAITGLRVADSRGSAVLAHLVVAGHAVARISLGTRFTRAERAQLRAQCLAAGIGLE